MWNIYKPPCYETYVSHRPPATPAFYTIYSLASIIGIFLNGFLFYAYLYGPKTILGSRSTFIMIMKMYTISDFLLSVLLIPTMIMVDIGPYEKNIAWDIYIPLRNMLLNFLTVILLVLALDRFIAAVAPTSKLWNCKLVLLLMFIPWLGGFIIEIFFFIVTYTSYPCAYKFYTLKVYSNFYSYQTIIVLGLLLVIYVITFAKVVYQLNKTSKNDQSLTLQTIKDNLRFTFVILALTIVIIWALLPFFLSNFGIVADLNYILYYSYYLISPIDPLIFMLTNRNFRKHFRELLCHKAK